MNTLTVSWFSAGVSSAVATWLALPTIDEIIYTHIDDQHQDSLRFVKDCEAWWGRNVQVIQSELKSVGNACLAASFINSPSGATCTKILKRRVRVEWENSRRFFCTFRYVWGFDANEHRRIEAIRDAMPDCEHVFPLAERGISKREAHGILKKHGIKRPAMYDMGYPNNNCVGCVKGGAGYWNKIRVDFPEVFAARAAMERAVGASCINGTYLDELKPSAGRGPKIILPECGAACEMLD